MKKSRTNLIETAQKRRIKGIARPKEIPRWMECTWRRKPCGQDDCPICGSAKKDFQKQLEFGENPEDLKIVLEDVGKNLQEVLTLIQKDARKKGIKIANIEDIKQPPDPESFPLYVEVRDWQKSIFDLAENSHNSFWTYTEDALDLFWYTNTLGAKVYRQLCNKWQIEHKTPYGEFDSQYTSYVLNECLQALYGSLSRLILVGASEKGKLIFLSAQTMILEEKIIKI